MNIEVSSTGALEQKEETPTIRESEKEQKKKSDPVSELRQDLVTGDWVVIATGRAKRPDEFGKYERVKNDTGIDNCLFEDPVATGQEKDVLIYHREDGEWTLRVFPNKYPAFARGALPKNLDDGPYFAMNGSGYHEVVVTRDHYKHIQDMEDAEVAEIFDAFQDRYLELMNRKSVNYVALFHNYGKEAGASISHPHSQLMAIPVISPYIKQELDGAELYHKKNKHCVFCTISDYESDHGKRVVFENNDFIAFCPFSSRAAFEIWVMPKKHSPYFERITNEQKMKLAQVFKKALNSVCKALNDPPYNFYIHTAPCDGKDYPHFHWHIEILPHTSTWAGFELETGIEISTIQPEVAAEYLRSVMTNG
ncbi:MAG: Galactose-1-phosphate uridylyltransferase [Candidatus Moranbacteria bacterium GW2011_GWE2_47_10]|nr:MAG: Galactose-1-phosphate uridylyltransferase [Candidatus Moranbacteria bacterium GW2011_GWE2_47_10]HBP01134.1 galactose-1-phosphate uridylyltransferase [Candidatus Moranbacteria bacterium]